MTKPTATARALMLLYFCISQFATWPIAAEVRPPLRVPLGKSFQPGIIFPIDNDADRIPELQSIKDQGFRVICNSVRHHDVPIVGSQLRTRVDAVLDWCDANEMGFFLELVIQYRSPREIGDVEKGYIDAVGYVRPHVEHWVDTLAGHPCVLGVTLGNEVGPGWPATGTEAEMPNYTQGWRAWLLKRHGDLASLNAAWGTSFSDMSEIGFPGNLHELEWVGPPDRQVFIVRPESEPGFFDLQRFSNIQFGRFYSQIFDQLFRPVLGEIGYACETESDPYLYRAFPGASVLCWDIVAANYPPWVLKVFADTDSRPVYNSEFHVYHDAVYHWAMSGGEWKGASAALTRYRYLMDVLSGQWVTTMFMFRDFTKPDIAAVHRETPETFREISRLEPLIRRLNLATQTSRLGVLVTEPMWQFSRSIQWHYSPPLERAYAGMAATGRPWRYVLDIDLDREAPGLDTLVAWSYDKIPVESVEAVVALPETIQVVWVGPWPTLTEYDQPLTDEVRGRLARRCRQVAFDDQLTDLLADPSLPSFYRERVEIPFRWWNPDKDWIASRVQNVRVEARRSTDEKGEIIVALINHTGDSVTLPRDIALPWAMRAIDVTGEEPVPVSLEITLRGFDVRFLRYDVEPR
jgi:hypothetical protein